MEPGHITPLAVDGGGNIEFFNRLVGFSNHSGTSLFARDKAVDNSRPDGDEIDVLNPYSTASPAGILAEGGCGPDAKARTVAGV